MARKLQKYIKIIDKNDFSKEVSSYQFYKQKTAEFIERTLMGDSDAILFSSVLGFMWAMFAWDFYLNYRQRKILKNSPKPPKNVTTMISHEDYTRVRLYALDKNLYNMVNSTYYMFQLTIILVMNFLPLLWTFSIWSTLSWTRDHELSVEDHLSDALELRASLVFLMYVILFSFADGLPWKLYSNFVLEKKHEFNKQSFSFYILDQLKSLVISLCLTLPITYCLLYITKWGGQFFYLYAWSFAFVIMTFLTFIYPEFIAPSFDNFSLLPEGELKAEIEDLTNNLKFPLQYIYIVENSKRKCHSNAYYYGIWNKKQIVLCDTLVKKLNKISSLEDKGGDDGVNRGFSNAEIIAILSHELGHWKMNHAIQNLIIGQVNLFLIFFTFGNLFKYETLFKTFGFREVGTPSIIKMVIIFQYLFSPYNALMEFVMTLFIRQNEFQADEFATKLVNSDTFISALIKLQKVNMTFPLYDNLFSIFNNSHPSILERINAIKSRHI